MAEVKSYKVLSLPSRPSPDSIYWVKGSSTYDVIGYITDRNGVPYPLKDLQGSGGITALTNTDGNLVITGADNKVINLAPALLSIINSALQSGDNISELVNDAGYITSVDLPTKTSELINDGSDATSTYVESDELGAVAFSNDYNDLDNKPTIPTVITNHSGLSLDDGTNPHGTTKGDVGLGDVPNLNTTEAVNKAHEHTNFSVLNGTEESFTTALKNAYNSAVSWITTNGTNLINHLSNTSNPHNVTKSQVGLGSVDNTSDIDKPISTATQTELDDKLDKVSTAGVERAYIINADGSQSTKATSEFKDVLEFANFSSFPTTGETGIIYVALDKNFTYRWSGSAYVQIGGTTKKTENLFFQDAVGSTVRTITADQKNMHQSRFLANASPYGVLGLTLGNGITEVGGVVNISIFSDSTVSQVTGNYTGKVKKIVFSYARNVNESSANTNLMIRVMADTKYMTDMQLICEHNLISSSLAGTAENKVELPILSHLPLSAFSNIRWCIRSNNATAQQFGIIRLNVIVEEI